MRTRRPIRALYLIVLLAAALGGALGRLGRQEPTIGSVCAHMWDVMQAEMAPAAPPGPRADFDRTCIGLGIDAREAFMAAGQEVEYKRLLTCQLAAHNMNEMDRCDDLTPTPGS